ncbi:MAG: glycerol-3-phosphate dehydrogenase/oxidase [Bacteroidales bacterium]|jgi:glycerol-3-phosphate dehydrogenase|nr:glycerol-3-phosphate dehydrogenase/oxidase [Bacteroidales bacterium]
MERIFDQTTGTNFDLIVIGGGITGVSVAYEAASRGLKVALFEKGDFGEATSAATSKLIHGGLRYLKNMEFGLVRESLTERRILENIAPNLVYPLPFMIPTYSNLKNNKQILFIGMVLYDLLSFDKAFTWDKSKKLPFHRTIGAKKTKTLEPCIPDNKLTGASIYYDCQNINPERLTLEFLTSAIKYGARVANYARVDAFIQKDQILRGVTVHDLLTGIKHDFYADVTINCTGPWTDILLSKSMNKQAAEHHIRRSEGIHIITKKLCNKHAVTMMTQSGRHIMLMPWRNHSLIGTTDKEYKGDPDDYKISRESIQELIDEVNANYGIQKLNYKDVLFAYGGLRPLVDRQTEASYESSRKYEITDHAREGLDSLITVEGGKYTTSRNLAFHLINRIAKKRKIKVGKSVSKKRYLVNSDIRNMESFIRQLALRYPMFSEATINYVGRNYGLKCHPIFRLAMRDKSLAQVLTDDGEILAEVVYVIKKEMAFTLTDILFRRTGIGTLGYPGDESFNQVVDTAKAYLNWDAQRTKAEIDQVMKIFAIPQ